MLVAMAANWYPTITGEGIARPLGHLWSVYLELQGYIVFGALVYLVHRYSLRSTAALFSLIGASIVWIALSVYYSNSGDNMIY